MTSFALYSASGQVIFDDSTPVIVLQKKVALTWSGSNKTTAGVRLWELGYGFPSVAVSANNANYVGIYQLTYTIEVFSSLPSPTGYPDNLVIVVTGVSYYRKVSGSWTTISAISVTQADREQYCLLDVYAGGGTSAPTSGTMYVFGPPNNSQKATTGFVGIETYDASGNLLWNSGLSPINIAAAYSGNLSSSTSMPHTLTTVPGYTGSKSYAIMQFSWQLTRLANTPISGFYTWMIPAVRVSSGNLDMTGISYASSTNPNLVTTSYRTTDYSLGAYAIDVTGL